MIKEKLVEHRYTFIVAIIGLIAAWTVVSNPEDRLLLHVILFACVIADLLKRKPGVSSSKINPVVAYVALAVFVSVALVLAWVLPLDTAERIIIHVVAGVVAARIFSSAKRDTERQS